MTEIIIKGYEELKDTIIKVLNEGNVVSIKIEREEEYNNAKEIGSE